MKPNFYACQECPQWDDVNGCWANCKTVCDAGLLDEDGNYKEDNESGEEECQEE